MAPDDFAARRPSRTIVTGGHSVQFSESRTGDVDEVLDPPAIEFLVMLHRRFEERRRELLAQRGGLRRTLAAGAGPEFPRETESIRSGDWTVSPPPPDLVDRRVEITGPTDRKMVINALNSGARTFMADFEDAHSPTWTGTLRGQVNLYDAVRRTISYAAPDGRSYRLNERTATLMVRPRGWHLDEAHFRVDDRPISASLFDFGLFVAHNALELRRRGTGVYLYLPKLEHYLEARLWQAVFRFAEESLGLPEDAIRATVLIETLPAAFQMDEILWELRSRSVGLNCGRWDYLFSFMKQLADVPDSVFPDRSRLTMTTPFMSAYSDLLVRTCHRRGAHAIGGMAAQIPIKDDPTANAEAFALVVADKEREVTAGYDGTWVAHPGLVPVAMAVFDQGMPGPNQVDRPVTGGTTRPGDLMSIPRTPVTMDGVRTNARAALGYLHGWLRGIGCVPLDHRMEDAATAEIARTQLWQWVHHRAVLEDKRPVDLALVRQALEAEQQRFLADVSLPTDSRSLERALALLNEVISSNTFVEFITEYAYPQLGDPQPGVDE